MRWNARSEWVRSAEQVHEALVSAEDFDTAQARFARTTRATRTPVAGHRYQLAGMMRCAICGRRMRGQWNHGRAYYRCKYADDYAAGALKHPKSVYVKEDAILSGLDRFLNEKFNEDIDQTAEILAGHDEPEPEVAERQATLRAQIKDCDRRLERYRTAIDHADGEIGSITKWIAEVERERRNLQTQLGRVVPGGKLTKSQIKALMKALRDIVSVLAEADADDRAELYQQLGVELVYHPDGRVAVEALPRGLNVRVGGATQTLTPRAATVGWFAIAA